MKNKLYIILVIVSIFLFACSDELFEDMDNAINNPQNPGGDSGGDLYNNTTFIVEYKIGVAFDGIKDSLYDDVASILHDESGDDPLESYSGTDIKSCSFIQDDFYLWVYCDFWDGSPDPVYGLTDNRAYSILFQYPNEGSWTAGVDIFHDGAGWISLFGGGYLAGDVNVGLNGIECRFDKPAFTVISNEHNFLFQEGPYPDHSTNDLLIGNLFFE